MSSPSPTLNTVNGPLRGIASALAGLLLAAPASAQTRITFPARSDSGFWAGHTRGIERFVLNLGKGQQFTVCGNDIYTWSLRAPGGALLPCDSISGTTSCPPSTTARLPITGDYTVETTHRMGGGIYAPTLSSRYVRITFTAR